MERQTKQKQMIYDGLRALDHPTATELYGYARELQPTISRATVFRVLGGFVASGRAQEIRSAGSEVRYDFRIEPHYHVRCMRCGRVADVQAEMQPVKMLSTPTECEFSVEGYTVEFFGSCRKCRKIAP